MADWTLPQGLDPHSFDALHDQPARWQPLLAHLARRWGVASADVQPLTEGTVLVAGLRGRSVPGGILKLYPPFLRDHAAFEAAALQQLGGRLSLPTPSLCEQGVTDGWSWLLMTRLPGEVLTPLWPTWPEADRCTLLQRLGALAAEVHRHDVEPLRAAAPAWPSFLAQQRAACAERQQRTGLPPHLQAQLAGFLQGTVPTGPDVILTGEYTPMNLLVAQRRLCGMFDFGDGLVGPREYDWLGPLVFLAAGHATRCEAFFEGYGVAPSRHDKQALLRLLLLHRYSNLQAQIQHPGWQQAESFEALAERIWP